MHEHKKQMNKCNARFFYVMHNSYNQKNTTDLNYRDYP